MYLGNVNQEWRRENKERSKLLLSIILLCQTRINCRVFILMHFNSFITCFDLKFDAKSS